MHRGERARVWLWMPTSIRKRGANGRGGGCRCTPSFAAVCGRKEPQKGRRVGRLRRYRRRRSTGWNDPLTWGLHFDRVHRPARRRGRRPVRRVRRRRVRQLPSGVPDRALQVRARPSRGSVARRRSGRSSDRRVGAVVQHRPHPWLDRRPHAARARTARLRSHRTPRASGLTPAIRSPDTPGGLTPHRAILRNAEELGDHVHRAN